MNSKTIAIAAALYFAVFLLAHRQPVHLEQPTFAAVHDLSSASTTITAPDGRTLSKVTPDRFVVPVVVLGKSDTGHVLDLNDIGRFEQQHGTIHSGALVAVRAGMELSEGAVSFLVRARYVYGISADQQKNVEALKSARRLGLYTISGLNDLNGIPEADSIVVISPNVGNVGTTAPVRIYSLLR